MYSIPPQPHKMDQSTQRGKKIYITPHYSLTANSSEKIEEKTNMNQSINHPSGSTWNTPNWLLGSNIQYVNACNMKGVLPHMNSDACLHIQYRVGVNHKAWHTMHVYSIVQSITRDSMYAIKHTTVYSYNLITERDTFPSRLRSFSYTHLQKFSRFELFHIEWRLCV